MPIMIQNYLKILKVYKFLYSILEFNYTRNYTSNDSDKTTYVYQVL